MGLYSGLSGVFSLLPDELLPDAGWQEYALDDHIIDDQDDVASLSRFYHELRGQALCATVPDHDRGLRGENNMSPAG